MTDYHNAVKGNKHPNGELMAYCRLCSRAIVFCGGVWWHITRKASNRARGIKEAGK